MVITVLDNFTRLVLIQSGLLFRFLDPILLSILERFLKPELNNSCCSVV
jgi:hypothetical protein